MNNDRLQELLNLILFTHEIVQETDSAHVEICECFNEMEVKLKKLKKERDYWKLSFYKQVEASRK